MAEERQGDSYASFTYRNYFGAHAVWKRDTVLTREGILVVRDSFAPGTDHAGFRAGPVWCLRADGQWKVEKGRNGQEARRFINAPPHHDGKRHWFDAPAYDYAAWQSQPRRLLVYIHPENGQSYGQLQHDSTPDFSRDIKTNSSWAAAEVRAGETKVFLSVLLPYNPITDANRLARRVRSRINAAGECRVTYRKLEVRMDPGNHWTVERTEE